MRRGHPARVRQSSWSATFYSHSKRIAERRHDTVSESLLEQPAHQLGLVSRCRNIAEKARRKSQVQISM
jgi:hypothetical protein